MFRVPLHGKGERVPTHDKSRVPTHDKSRVPRHDKGEGVITNEIGRGRRAA
jgi:hypothetical protein